MEENLITIIECPHCSDKKTTKTYKGNCKCGNLSIDSLTPKTKCKFKYFTTVSYKHEPPNIYEISSSLEKFP
jgi:hypothetical protein